VLIHYLLSVHAYVPNVHHLLDVVAGEVWRGKKISPSFHLPNAHSIGQLRSPISCLPSPHAVSRDKQRDGAARHQDNKRCTVWGAMLSEDSTVLSLVRTIRRAAEMVKGDYFLLLISMFWQLGTSVCRSF
jgi:hypothetical protein